MNDKTKSKIMVVEDEAIVSADIQDRLHALGYIVAGDADTGTEAIRKVGELKPDLILMDIMLKGEMTGIEAAGHIRSQFHLPIIYLTANSNDETVMRARDTEPFGFILKPFEEATLKVNIEMALYKHRMEREREELIVKLQAALAEVKTLSGLIPICAWCKNVRNDKNYWETVEQYIYSHTGVDFTHCVCPSCKEKFMEDFSRKYPKPGSSASPA